MKRFKEVLGSLLAMAAWTAFLVIALQAGAQEASHRHPHDAHQVYAKSILETRLEELEKRVVKLELLHLEALQQATHKPSLSAEQLAVADRIHQYSRTSPLVDPEPEETDYWTWRHNRILEGWASCSRCGGEGIWFPSPPCDSASCPDCQGNGVVPPKQ